jgi:RNA polymerase sigma-70 factor (ECF subfamily)
MQSGTDTDDDQTPSLQFALPLRGQLLAHARRLSGNDADASDLVQDTFERALRAARRPKNPDEFRPWLMRVLNNLWIDRLRSARVREAFRYRDDAALPAAAQASAPDSSESWRDLSVSDIAAVLADVPEPHRTAFRLHALERLSYAEVARVLGVVPATVGTRILRARRLLRTLVSAQMNRKAS